MSSSCHLQNEKHRTGFFNNQINKQTTLKRCMHDNCSLIVARMLIQPTLSDQSNLVVCLSNLRWKFCLYWGWGYKVCFSNGTEEDLASGARSIFASIFVVPRWREVWWKLCDSSPSICHYYCYWYHNSLLRHGDERTCVARLRPRNIIFMELSVEKN